VKLAADFGTGGSAMAGALLIFAAVWLDERFQRALDNRVLRFLGSLSFAIYALHFLVLGSVTWHAYQAFLPLLGHHAAAAAATAGSYALLIALAISATRWIDLPSTKLASLLARWLYAKGHAWLSSLAGRTYPVLNRQKTRQQKEPALSGFPDAQRDQPVAAVEHHF
jgi:peptidoglycan/LPS O-acetylase OafA/YrhL